MRTCFNRRHLILGTLAAAIVGCQPQQPKLAVQPVNSEAAGQLNSAYSSFDELKEPKLTAKTHLAAARLAESRGDVKTAILQYQEVLRIDPRADEALYRLGVLLTEQKQYPEARAVWQRYMIATDGSATAYANLGFCWQLENRYDEAEKIFKAGLERDPTNASCRVNLGLLYARQKKYAEAVSELKRVLKPHEVWYNIGSAAELSADVPFARDAYLKALEAEPDFVPAQTRLQALTKTPATAN